MKSMSKYAEIHLKIKGVDNDIFVERAFGVKQPYSGYKHKLFAIV